MLSISQPSSTELLFLVALAKLALKNIPVRGQGKKKSNDEVKALTEAAAIFRDMAKNGPLNLPLDQPDPTGCGGTTGIFFLRQMK